MRRGRGERPAVLKIGDLSLDPASRTCKVGDAKVSLTAREFSLLEYLMARGGDVVSKKEILDHVWDFDFDGDPNIIEVYIRHLRNKLDRPFDRNRIRTARGAGYRVADDDE